MFKIPIFIFCMVQLVLFGIRGYRHFEKQDFLENSVPVLAKIKDVQQFTETSRSHNGSQVSISTSTKYKVVVEFSLSGKPVERVVYSNAYPNFSKGETFEGHYRYDDMDFRARGVNDNELPWALLHTIVAGFFTMTFSFPLMGFGYVARFFSKTKAGQEFKVEFSDLMEMSQSIRSKTVRKESEKIDPHKEYSFKNKDYKDVG